MIIKRDDGREFLMVTVDEIRAAEANASDRPEVDEDET